MNKPDAIAIALDAKPVPVILDFVEPVGAVWDGLRPGWKAELKHTSKIGGASGNANPAA
jgi:hypothetical protein